MPAKRFDYDWYNDHKSMKKVDFAVGLLISSAAWYFLFKPYWFIAPIIIFTASMLGIVLKIKRRYFIYGALATVFFPLVIWGGLMIGWAGRNEISTNKKY